MEPLSKTEEILFYASAIVTLGAILYTYWHMMYSKNKK